MVTTVPLLAASRERQLAVQPGFFAHPEADASDADTEADQLAGDCAAGSYPELVWFAGADPVVIGAYPLKPPLNPEPLSGMVPDGIVLFRIGYGMEGGEDVIDGVEVACGDETVGVSPACICINPWPWVVVS